MFDLFNANVNDLEEMETFKGFHVMNRQLKFHQITKLKHLPQRRNHLHSRYKNIPTPTNAERDKVRN